MQIVTVSQEQKMDALQRITQDQLAARLGTVREVVSRSLRELERSGAILVENRQIQILDLEMLQDWAQVPSRPFTPQ